MPPLYRMPVFYLAGLVLALVVGVGSLARSTGFRTARTTSDSLGGGKHSLDSAASPRPPEASKASDTPQAVAEVVDDSILRTADGLRRKVVVKDLDVICQSKLLGGHPVGSPLDYFSIHYLFGEAQGN